MKMSLYTQIILASSILLVILISGCGVKPVEVDPTTAMRSSLLIPNARWSKSFDPNDWESIQTYNLVALREALIETIGRVSVLEKSEDGDSDPNKTE